MLSLPTGLMRLSAVNHEPSTRKKSYSKFFKKCFQDETTITTWALLLLIVTEQIVTDLLQNSLCVQKQLRQLTICHKCHMNCSSFVAWQETKIKCFCRTLRRGNILKRSKGKTKTKQGSLLRTSTKHENCRKCLQWQPSLHPWGK